MMFPNFELSEFLESDTARRKKIDNFPSFEVVEHLKELTSTILQPLRSAWGSGIVVTSGYRCPELNKALSGASDTSVHPLGYASDLQPSNGEFDKFVIFAQDFLMRNGIPFDQLIVESNKGSRWLHIGLKNRAGEQRRQIKTISL